MESSGTSKTLEPNINPTANCQVVDLQFDLTCISNGEVRREVMTISERDFELSVKFIRSLIETRFNIPLVCQIRLSLGDISLDCLESDETSVLPSRIQKKGERLPLALHYYTDSVPLKPIDKMLEQFASSIDEENFRLIYIILNSMNHEHMDQLGWDSKEAMGTRIYLRNCGFLSKLLTCIISLNKGLLDTFHSLKDNESVEAPEIIARAESISTALDAALAFVWNFGAKTMDRIYLHRKGFLQASMESIRIARMYMDSNCSSFEEHGRLVFYKCIGVIQGFSELRTPAIEIGNDQPLISLLRNSIQAEANFSHSENLNSVIYVLIFFSISSQCEISKKLYDDNTYLDLLKYFSGLKLHRDYSNCNYELFYVGCLLMLNLLRTPPIRINQSQDQLIEKFKDILGLFDNFLYNVKLEDILKFEDYYKFIWGTLDPFTSFFFIPSNSLFAWLYFADPEGLYKDLCHFYFRIALFSLDLLLSREISRKQLLEENLLTHLIIAAWKIPEIFPRLKHKYPEISYLPVPSLYDIATVQLVCQGGGNYNQLIHSSL